MAAAPLIGVVISVAASLYATSKQTKNELNKLRIEMQKLYSGRLQEKRLEIYPQLYFLLSSFQKRVEIGDVSRPLLQKLFEETNEWNSRHSFLFSGRTGFVSFNFRTELRRLLSMEEGEFTKFFQRDTELTKLKHQIGEFELSLKSDVGIYIVEFSDLDRRYTAYRDLDAEYKKDNA